MKAKYLFYDNIVKGAGIGHTLFSYNSGLNQAIRNNQCFIPPLMQLGHGLGRRGLLEAALGLPNCLGLREELEKLFPKDIETVKYHPQKSCGNVCEDFSLTRPYFLSCYKNRILRVHEECPKDVTTICMTIRRGDIACNRKWEGDAHPMENRLLPDMYYKKALDYLLETYNIQNFLLYIYSDADWTDQYINEKCKPVDVYKFFNYKNGDIKYVPSQKTADNTIVTFQTCIESDFFIASVSGFSEAITLYKTKGKTLIPEGKAKFFCPESNIIKYKTNT